MKSAEDKRNFINLPLFVVASEAQFKLQFLSAEATVNFETRHRGMGVEGAAKLTEKRLFKRHKSTLDGTSSVWRVLSVQPSPGWQRSNARTLHFGTADLERPVWLGLSHILGTPKPCLQLHIQVCLGRTKWLLWATHGAVQVTWKNKSFGEIKSVKLQQHFGVFKHWMS